jgi:hypothetical protein
VDEVCVKIGCAELFEGGVEVGFDILGTVRVVPQLGDKEDVRPRDT